MAQRGPTPGTSTSSSGVHSSSSNPTPTATTTSTAKPSTTISTAATKASVPTPAPVPPSTSSLTSPPPPSDGWPSFSATASGGTVATAATPTGTGGITHDVTRPHRPKSVVVAIDRSRHSAHALAYALQYIVQFKRDHLTILAVSVVPDASTWNQTVEAAFSAMGSVTTAFAPGAVTTPDGSNPVTPASANSQQQRMVEAEIQELLADARTVVTTYRDAAFQQDDDGSDAAASKKAQLEGDHGGSQPHTLFPTQYISLPGTDPSKTIVAYVNERKTDLLVVGSRGLGPVQSALLGSVSAYCATHAVCPVTIVKLPPAEGEITTSAAPTSATTTTTATPLIPPPSATPSSATTSTGPPPPPPARPPQK